MSKADSARVRAVLLAAGFYGSVADGGVVLVLFGLVTVVMRRFTAHGGPISRTKLGCWGLSAAIVGILIYILL